MLSYIYCKLSILVTTGTEQNDQRQSMYEIITNITSKPWCDVIASQDNIQSVAVGQNL